MKRGTPIPSGGLAAVHMGESENSLETPRDDGEASVDTKEAPSSSSREHDDPIQVAPESDGTIVRNIASYLSFSDVASMAGTEVVAAVASNNATATIANVGSHRSFSSFTYMTTPETPGLMALSPDEGVLPGDETVEDDEDDEDIVHQDSEEIRSRLARRRRQMVQEKLSAAIFAHPRSLRSFCLEAHQAAMEIKRNRQPQHENPETQVEPAESRRERLEREQRMRIFHRLIELILYNVPLSVGLDLMDAFRETGLDTSFAVLQLSVNGVNAIVDAIGRVVGFVWDAVSSFNPLALLDAIISLQFNAMGKTSEVLVSGIQSVATGVGSASNMALSRLSRTGHHHANMVSSASLSGSSGNLLRRNKNEIFNPKLLKKLSAQNSAAEVIAYQEREDEALTRHARKRVQRMMHYDVSLRPFLATIKLPQMEPFENFDMMRRNQNDPDGEDDSVGTETTSPVLCTPMSFPPTPASRSQVLARGNRFAEDVVFLARDKLRVQDGLDSENERTRAMAKALREGSRLAVFNAADVASGIALTCGQHVATKVGNVLYCSTRGMVPVLRNCFVYFEMSVFSPTGMLLQSSMATLSVGLSTLEMPLNTLVGAWKGSVGLCSTGQILTAGQWCSPTDPSSSAYGDSATVGCLVCLDDHTAFETWDGVMVTAAVTFNVNGQVVTPPISTTPMPSGGGLAPHELPGPAPPSSTLPLLVPIEEELFPTLTLHSPATQVMCRFSAEDTFAGSRAEIGAPPGVAVYAIDGSVLLEDIDV